MAMELQGGVPENLKKHLALAVRSIQWSYAIFWSNSAQQPGVLEWGDGFYNGDIKTRKTVQAMEIDANQIVFQRSEQLRELYESLSIGEASPQAKRPSAALSPEDLTDAEWYYLVCMSFIFNTGQGILMIKRSPLKVLRELHLRLEALKSVHDSNLFRLPGRTYTTGQPIWLCDAHVADSKIFSRSLLAKSASIQTVVCFPFLDGVVELGVADLVFEDPCLIQRLQASFLDASFSLSSSAVKPRNVENIPSTALACKIFKTKEILAIHRADLDMTSPSNGSNRMESNQLAEGSTIGDGRSRGASQLMDDEISNCAQQSVNSSDCISQTFVEPQKVNSYANREKVKSHLPNQEDNRPKLNLWAPRKDDLHYRKILSNLFNSSNGSILGSLGRICRKDSSFISWNRGLSSLKIPRGRAPQIRLKKILLEVPRWVARISAASPKSCGHKTETQIQEADKMETNHALSEKRQRDKLHERFFFLSSLIPSTSKDDEVIVLNEAIDYLKQLERRVKELESVRDPTESETRTSDNYGNNKKTSNNTRKSPPTKRKACDVIEMEETDESLGESINVHITHKEVMIRLRCAWRDGALLDIMDVINNFHLDSHSVQSSTTEGILSLTIKAKFNASPVASARTIQQALRQITGKC